MQNKLPTGVQEVEVRLRAFPALAEPRGTEMTVRGPSAVAHLQESEPGQALASLSQEKFNRDHFTWDNPPVLVKAAVQSPPRAVILTSSTRVEADIDSVHPQQGGISYRGHPRYHITGAPPQKYNDVQERPIDYHIRLGQWMADFLWHGYNQRTTQAAHLSGPSVFGLEGSPDMAIIRARLWAGALATLWGNKPDFQPLTAFDPRRPVSLETLRRDGIRNPMVATYVINQESPLDHAFGMRGAEFLLMMQAIDERFPGPWMMLNDDQIEAINEAGENAFPKPGNS